MAARPIQTPKPILLLYYHSLIINDSNTITILPFKANTMLAIEPRSFSNAKLHLAYSHRDACAGYEAQESFLRLRELLVFNSCFVLC